MKEEETRNDPKRDESLVGEYDEIRDEVTYSWEIRIRSDKGCDVWGMNVESDQIRMKKLQ